MGFFHDRPTERCKRPNQTSRRPAASGKPSHNADAGAVPPTFTVPRPRTAEAGAPIGNSRVKPWWAVYTPINGRWHMLCCGPTTDCSDARAYLEFPGELMVVEWLDAGRPPEVLPVVNGEIG